QYFTGPVSYAFGHGLTYSRFAYSNLRLDTASVDGDGTVTAFVDVRNTGSVAAKEVVQLYATAPGSDGIARPQRQLRGFEKVSLASGQTATVSIEVAAKDLWFWDEDAGKAVWDEGAWRIQVGPEAGVGPATFVTLTGPPRPALATVMTVPDGIRLNLNAPHTAIHANLSATDIDQSFFDLGAPGVEVVYTTSDPAVAIVDDRGAVTPAGLGAATITATVTANGLTKSSSFPVVVQGDDDGPVIDLPDQVLQVTGTSATATVAGTAELLPTGSTATVAYLIAPMDENSAEATIDADGAFTATKAGRTRITAVATISDGSATPTTMVQSAWITVLPTQAAPVIAGAVNQTPSGPSGSYAGDVTVTFDVTAGALPVVETKVDDGEWTLAPGRSVIVTGEGTHTVAARVFDQLGRSAETSITVVIASALPGPGAASAVTAPGRLTLSAAGAGVSVEYSPDGATWLPYSGPLAIFGWVYYRAVNEIGSGEVGLVWVPQDTTPPTITVTPPAITVTPPAVTVNPPDVVVPTPVVSIPPAAPAPPVVVPAPIVTVVPPAAAPDDRASAAPPILATPVVKSTRPTIKGTAKVGKKLTARPGNWTAGATYSYKWYASGKVIAKATGPTLKLTKAMAGKKIQVKVTGKLSGYTSATRASLPTRKVAKK
ncbi:MAG: fibronectin type III-like domain-contianing protein, partial [Bifidobacteriaceae bacterium]|nr:fibronectin type III-like domain-contianing protein [Bifidobacteriaceae bacterium]